VGETSGKGGRSVLVVSGSTGLSAVGSADGSEAALWQAARKTDRITTKTTIFFNMGFSFHF
jgi:hypothetical protein